MSSFFVPVPGEGAESGRFLGAAGKAALLALLGGLLSLGVLFGFTAFAQVGADAYELGPGDQIAIRVFGEPDLSMDVRLGDAGTLNYPFLGELELSGLSTAELEQRITSGLKGPYLVNPEVTVSVLEYRPFFLHGEVQNPGGFAYQAGLTVEQAVALAGGFTERAARNRITVVRADDPEQTSRPIRLSDPVRPGDLVSVAQSFF